MAVKEDVTSSASAERELFQKKKRDISEKSGGGNPEEENLKVRTHIIPGQRFVHAKCHNTKLPTVFNGKDYRSMR